MVISQGAKKVLAFAVNTRPFVARRHNCPFNRFSDSSIHLHFVLNK